MRNKQVAPGDAADILAEVVKGVTYKPGWTFELRELERGQGCEGLTLLIGAEVPDSTVPGATTSVLHLMPVLPANSTVKPRTSPITARDATHTPRMRIKPATQPQEAAEPWQGGPVTDPHFKA